MEENIMRSFFTDLKIDIFIGALVFLMCFNMKMEAFEFYDVETLPLQRTKQYMPGTHKKIVIFSAKRTGSSLLYNIFRFLFEEEAKLNSIHNDYSLDRIVLKTHIYEELGLVEEENPLFVYTYRNPIDAAISYYRVNSFQVHDLRAFAQETLMEQYEYLLLFKGIQNRWNAISFKYEDFVENIDMVFKEIEVYFQITIDPRDKKLMKQGYSRENIHLCIQNLTDFTQFLPISGFHGKHVCHEKFSPPSSLFHWLQFYLQDLKPIFHSHGYSFDSFPYGQRL